MNVDIANILKDKIKDLPFIDRIGGLVRPVTITQNDGERNVRKVFPVDCNVTQKDCVAGKYQDLVPDNRKKSVTYFEDGGIRFISREADRLQFESTLKLVCWLNLQKLGKENCSISALAMGRILVALPGNFINDPPYTRMQIRVSGQDPKSPAIFQRYTYDEAVTQYLLYPFDYFAVTITTSFSVPLKCISSWTAEDENACVDYTNGNN